VQGIKTVVTVNDNALVTRHAAEAASSNEIWLDYTDDAPPLRAKHPGDPRAAFTPWLAHKVADLLLVYRALTHQSCNAAWHGMTCTHLQTLTHARTHARAHARMHACTHVLRIVFICVFRCYHRSACDSR